MAGRKEQPSCRSVKGDPALFFENVGTNQSLLERPESRPGESAKCLRFADSGLEPADNLQSFVVV